MLLVQERTGRRVRLGYCMNLHPSDSVDGVLQGLADVTVPVRDRLVAAGRLAEAAPFGVGMYLPAQAAGPLARDPAELDRLAGALQAARLDPFTFNAFPYGGFHAQGLKRDVFRPTWAEAARQAFTLDVARVAVRLASRLDVRPRADLLSISTHAGCHASHLEDGFDADAADVALLATLRELAALERESGSRVVLAVEPEPRSRANDTAEWARHTRRFLDGLGPADRELARRHLGLCLDACHTAVEFESPEAATGRAAELGLPLGKLQFSSAIELREPGRNPAALAQLVELDEPVYLHQSTAARRSQVCARAGDLPELRAALDGPDGAAWRDADCLRTHFHVPVDLSRAGADDALGTTVGSADRLLEQLLRHPERWGSDELQVEIETYTWSVLPDAARGAGTLVDGLVREYEHTLDELGRLGFAPLAGP